MLSVRNYLFILSVIMLNVIMVIVVAPLEPELLIVFSRWPGQRQHEGVQHEHQQHGENFIKRFFFRC